jgi:hypothetical protein
MVLPIRNQDFILFHKQHIHSQAKNRCLCDSYACLQNTQFGSIGTKLNLSRVRSFPSTASQRMKLYLDRDHCSQITRTREIVKPTGLKKSYAWDIKDPAPVDQLLIKVILDSESPQCCKMRSLTEMIAFHSREVE